MASTIPISGGSSIRVDKSGKQVYPRVPHVPTDGDRLHGKEGAPHVLTDGDRTGGEQMRKAIAAGKFKKVGSGYVPPRTTPSNKASKKSSGSSKGKSGSGSKKKAVLKEKDFITMINRFHDELEVIYKNIKVLSVSYRALMTGDADGPYWNGATALSFYKTARGNLQNAVTAYQETMQAYKKLVTRYDNILRKGYWK